MKVVVSVDAFKGSALVCLEPQLGRCHAALPFELIARQLTPSLFYPIDFLLIVSTPEKIITPEALIFLFFDPLHREIVLPKNPYIVAPI
jgi:hypothetical protein